ncbi:MAG: lysophospholipid acyltransferase family protein [Deltaproteobacteria bacterium]|nr:lysophospholipid acyltransferase family protein [Deltaproteobacteria bacterium]
MKRKIKHLLYRQLLPRVGLFIVKVIAFTHRMRIVDPENERRFIDHDKSLIYISWHQRFFPGITFFAKRKPIAIMISQSHDGDMAAQGVKMLGWEPVRGSSTRGGREALEKLKNLALGGYKIGHIVDGPKGPFGVVKPGLLRIAQVSGLPIVPTITSAQKKWCLNSWDRFMVPKPFSRVIIRFGAPINIPADLNEDDFEIKRRLVEERLRQLYDDTDLIWTNPEGIKKIFK